MKLNKVIAIMLSSVTVLLASACGANTESGASEQSAPVQADTAIPENAPKLTLIGHSTVKIVTSEGKIIYIDPAYRRTALESYDGPADIILVTHGHQDHNATHLVTAGEDCRIITHEEALLNGSEYQTFEIDGIKIEAVPASNSNHDIKTCVGYVLTINGITLYHAGDTSTLQTLTDTLSVRELDYAMYPIDGTYNMDATEATAFANSIGAKHNIPMHISNYTDEYDEEKAKTFTPDGALYVAYGETIELS